MADPLSITTGVVALLTTCIKTGAAVKGFYDGAAIAGLKVKGLLSDVESFARALQLMKETLEQDSIQSSLNSTGHIGNHWTNLSISIQDGHHTLVQLQSTLDRVNKSVDILDGARKHLRLQGASQEIAMLQEQIRSYRDTIQLSLQTVIMWNQVTFKESTDKILPNLDELHDSIRRIAFDINTRMTTLQTLVESKTKDEHIKSLSNLRKCVQSAASVVSSASTTLGVESTDMRSDFGDCFPQEPSETMLRWISSKSIDGSEDGHVIVSMAKRHGNAYGKSMPQLDETSEVDGFDSDEDLEVEIIQSLLRRGRKKLGAKDFAGAERLFRNCLLRATSNGPLAPIPQTSKSEIMMLLLQTYRQQGKWAEAQSLLSEKIAMGSRESAMEEVLSDMLSLVEVLLEKEAYAEALLYGRQALKGYRRLGEPGTYGVGESLQHLVKICHLDGNVDEEEAYAAILADFMDQQFLIASRETPLSKPRESLEDGANTLNGHLVSDKHDTALRETHHAETSIMERPEARIVAPAFLAHSELFQTQRHDSSLSLDKPFTTSSLKNGFIAESSSVPCDVGSLPSSSSPFSELVMSSSISNQTGFRQTEPGPMSLPSVQIEAAEISQPSFVNPASGQSKEIYELEGDQFIESRAFISTESPPHTPARSDQSKSGEGLHHRLPPNSKTHIKHEDYNEPFSRSKKGSKSLSRDRSSQDTNNTSTSPGGAYGSYDPFNYTSDPASALPWMTPISAELEKFTNFTAIDGTAALPSKELPLVRVVRAPDPTISSSPPSPRMSDVAPTQPAKENISLRGQPQELLQPLEYPSLEEPKRSLGKLFQRQKFVPGSGIAQEIKSTELEKKQSNYSNSLTPVNSLSDIGISDSVTPAIKLVIVGDGQCGKTSLIIRFSKKRFPEKCPASNFGVYQANVKLLEYNYTPMTLDLCDTPGSDDCDHLRPVRYPQAQVILICFTIGDPASLDRVLNKWYDEVMKFCRRAPRLLVGLKTDLRHDRPTIERLALEGRRPITPAQAESVRGKIGALQYRECSGLTGSGMHEVFECATRLAMSASKTKSKRRSLLSLIGK